MSYPMAAWLEVPAPKEPSGWRRVHCLGTFPDPDDLPGRDTLSARAAATAAEHDLGDGFRWTLDFNGGARHRE